MADPVTAAVVGGSQLIAGRQARKAAESAQSAADRNAQLAYEQSLPWDVSGLFGEAKFDESTKQSTVSLSPELQKIYEDRLARADVTTRGLEAFDPAAYQQKFYEEQVALAAPGEERQRLALENRLRRQGLLTATAGASQARGLEEALQMKDLARRAESRSAAQQEQTFLRGLESADIGTALQLGALPMDYATMGRGIGTGMSSAAMSGANMRNQAAQNVADTQAAFWGGLASSVSGYAAGGNSFGTMFGTGTPAGYTPMGNQYFNSPLVNPQPSYANQQLTNYLYGGTRSPY